MKRDWDLIRDILIEIENAEDMDAFLNFSENGYLYPESLEKYGNEKITYHLQLLVNADFISTSDDDYGRKRNVRAYLEGP